MRLFATVRPADKKRLVLIRNATTDGKETLSVAVEVSIKELTEDSTPYIILIKENADGSQSTTGFVSIGKQVVSTDIAELATIACQEIRSSISTPQIQPKPKESKEDW